MPHLKLHDFCRPRFLSVAALALSFTLLAPTAKAGKETAAEDAFKVFGFVVLAEEGHQMQGHINALARIIVQPDNGQDLAAIDCSKSTLVSAKGGKPKDDKIIARPNPNPVNYPVAVCEAVIAPSATFSATGESWTFTLNGKSYPVQFPTVNLAPQQVMVLGDSGCRDNDTQLCNDATWPFSKTIPQDVAKSIAKVSQPALILHVGDYRYRGGNDGAVPDTWALWWADFFQPMVGEGGQNSLFAKAPWVVTRGNHELCYSYGNHGPGWFYFLDPTSPLNGDTTFNQCNLSTDTITAPYLLNFDHGFSLLVSDSSSIEKSGVNTAQAAQLTDTLNTAAATLNQDGHRLAWWVTHKPPFSATIDAEDGEAKIKFHNETEQQAIADAKNPDKLLKFMIGGHEHFYQSLSHIELNKKTTLPLQMVVGNSGVALDCDPANGNANKFKATIRGSAYFGYMAASLTLKDNKTITGWDLKPYAYAFNYPYKSDSKRWSDPTLIETCAYPADKDGICQVVDKQFFPTTNQPCDP